MGDGSKPVSPPGLVSSDIEIEVEIYVLILDTLRRSSAATV